MLTISSTFATTTARDLVRINSINPALSPGAPGETDIAAYTAALMERVGLEAQTHEAAPGRPSVVGRLRGTGGGRLLMLNAHYDTVDVEGMPAPFSGAVRDNRLYGRGSYDMKGSLASCLAAAKALIDSRTPLAGDVLIAAVADEEHASLGTQDLLRRYRVDGAIVTEPTALQICLAHKGFMWVEIETRGQAAHGSKPDLGIDANLRMGRVLAGLTSLEHTLQHRPAHPLVGRPSLHAATLAGGTGWSTYAASCRLQVERRTIPGETEEGVLVEFQELLTSLCELDPAFGATLTHVMTRAPFEVSRESPMVRAVHEGVVRVLGGAPRYIGDTPWMDSALLAAAGVDTVVIGPAGAGAHAAEEWVDLQSVADLASILAYAATTYCGTPPTAGAWPASS